MGRPPCCDKVGIKKGPWTPEEDIILVSYIQEHGPGNWRSVPTNTGLLRCSKSCRLRWTNYLRPGIKRGNFTAHEEGMIIHLQALLGNKWAAIASYLPQRTDNDIKNYWNTHLKKKLKKIQSSAADSKSYSFSSEPSVDVSSHQSSTNYRLNQTSSSSSTSTYASSAENISRLLQGWMRASPAAKMTNSTTTTTANPTPLEDNKLLHTNTSFETINSFPPNSTTTSIQCYRPKPEQLQDESADLICRDEFESILSFDNLNNVTCTWDKSSSDSPLKHAHDQLSHEPDQIKDSPPLSVLEKWLFDESTAAQGEDIMEMSPIF